LGVIHDWQAGDHLKLGPGGIYDFNFAPSSPTDSYGGDPHGTAIFIRAIVD
jgi:hypothetical protein